MGAKSVKIIVDVFRPAGGSTRGLFEACARVSQKNLGQKRRQILGTHEACAQSTAPRRATASALVALAKHLRTGRDSTFKGLDERRHLKRGWKKKRSSMILVRRADGSTYWRRR